MKGHRGVTLNEIVERAAIAVRKARSDFYWENAYEAPDDILALAVIRSLREPTQEMIDDAWGIGGDTDDEIRRVWELMIDAALK